MDIGHGGLYEALLMCTISEESGVVATKLEDWYFVQIEAIQLSSEAAQPNFITFVDRDSPRC